ncbi:MAG: hypothetical protein Q4B77_06630 [Coriobacteriaceae bacterium]|nr:hypothetical protein [Coriobacteriaceae bacterium]
MAMGAFAYTSADAATNTVNVTDISLEEASALVPVDRAPLTSCILQSMTCRD